MLLLGTRKERGRGGKQAGGQTDRQADRMTEKNRQTEETKTKNDRQ